ncbi:DUF805 domain-containing protein [Shewanella inventionis]|uniref:DUF805 domain-containing protein n=1 Tax=Shewanella inventionis TaxID=1738770 RepID=A0ABQ1IM92_9GAMM|nr:DUF805 domain-containing protein [Shewanella inventionis]MCL1156306.1 hypothetical protein [Shewanella inventionis]GGB44507.1 hypothetical protein GCM10011607_00670 [Shewanella inventionis]
MLVKTLLCHEGRDTGLRLMVIVFAAFALLSLAAMVFPASIIILIFTLVSLPIVGLSAIRRLYDANKTIKLVTVCILPVFIFGVSAYFMAPFGALAGLFLFGLACGAYLSFLPSKNNIQYELGYNGPNLVVSATSNSMHQRQDPVIKGQHSSPLTDASSNSFGHELTPHVERDNKADQSSAPTMHSTVDVEPHDIEDAEDDLPNEPHLAHHVDDDLSTGLFAATRERVHQPLYVDQDALKSGSITELAKSWINVAKLHQLKLILAGKIIAAIGIACALIYLVMALVNAISSSDSDDIDAEMTQGVIEPVSMTRQMVKLPDGFWLALEGDVLILRWLGDAGDAQNLWRLASAVGDQTCAHLAFNDGSQFRPLTVDLLADGATEARFSPLDKNVMVNNVALRGSFKLCGYEFSLKGSQAALMQNPQFESLLSQ